MRLHIWSQNTLSARSPMQTSWAVLLHTTMSGHWSVVAMLGGGETYGWNCGRSAMSWYSSGKLGRSVARWRPSSLLISTMVVNLTAGSLEASSWQACKTCCFLYSREIGGRLRPPWDWGRFPPSLPPSLPYAIFAHGVSMLYQKASM